jgi:hypothetical protein
VVGKKTFLYVNKNWINQPYILGTSKKPGVSLLAKRPPSRARHPDGRGNPHAQA